jgi:N-acetyl sugar amidotransferase
MNTSLFDDGLRRCSRCLLPETHETIEFDDAGVCNICRQVSYKQEHIDWQERFTELTELVDQHRGKHAYDCIVPFSGGKDSAFTLYYLVKALGLRPLAVRFNHTFLRPTVIENTQRVMNKLGVDFLEFTPSWQVVRRLMQESLNRKGDFCWHCHTGIFAYPMHVALRYRVPLILWGEPSAEYTSYYTYEEDEEVDERRFNRSTNLGITAQDMQEMVDGDLTAEDLAPFTYPDAAALRELRVRSVCLGSYIPWDVKRQVEIIKKELGWRGNPVEGVPPEFDYEKIECQMQGVRDYLKFIKRGYARATHLASIDIRNHRLSREEGEELMGKYEGRRPASLDVFLNHVGMSEQEFNDIAVSHAVAPFKPDIIRIASNKGERLPDQERWEEPRG